MALLFIILACSFLPVPKPASAQVAGLVPGDILVADFDRFGSLSGPGSVFRINPESEDFDTIAQNEFLDDPFGIAIESDGNIVIAEFGGPGSIVRINPVTGEQTVLTSGGNMNNPVRLDTGPNGDIFVADNSNTTNHIVRVDRITGAQTVVASGFSFPTGIAVDDDGDIFVTTSGDRSLIEVDPVTGTKRVIASGNPFLSPSDVAIEADGSLIVADFDFIGENDRGILRVNPITGDTDLLSSNFDKASGVAIDSNGDILVADLGKTGLDFDGRIVRVDAQTGDTIEVYSSNDLINPSDVAIFLTQVKPVAPDTILLGPEFNVRIDAVNALDLKGAQFELEYDSSLLSFVSAEFADGDGPCLNAFNDQEGTLKLAMVCDSERSGTSALWNLVFRSDGTFSTAETEFRLTEVFLNDASVLPEQIPGRGVRARSNVFVGRCGDVDDDTFVNVFDAIRTLRFALDFESADETQTFLADTNRNGFLDVEDAAGILGGVVGSISPLGCGPLLD
jgi:sugar lactone lactonase YvrE